MNAYRHHCLGGKQLNTHENNHALTHIPKRSPMLLNWLGSERFTRFLQRVSGLQPTTTRIKYPSKLQIIVGQ